MLQGKLNFDISSENYFFPICANNFCEAGEVPILIYFESCYHMKVLTGGKKGKTSGSQSQLYRLLTHLLMYLGSLYLYINIPWEHSDRGS